MHKMTNRFLFSDFENIDPADHFDYYGQKSIDLDTNQKFTMVTLLRLYTEYIEALVPVGTCQIDLLKPFIGDKDRLNNTAINSKSGIDFNQGKIKGDECHLALHCHGRLLPTRLMFSTFVANVLDDKINVDAVCPEFAKHVKGERYKEVSNRLKLLRKIPRITPKSPPKGNKRPSEHALETETSEQLDDKQAAPKRKRRKKKQSLDGAELLEAGEQNQQKPAVVVETIVEEDSDDDTVDDSDTDEENDINGDELENVSAQQFDKDQIDWETNSCDIVNLATADRSGGQNGLPSKQQFMKNFEKDIISQEDRVFIKEVLWLRKNNMIDRIKLKNDCGLKDMYAKGELSPETFASKYAYNFVSGLQSNAQKKAARDELKYIVKKRYVALRDEMGGPLQLSYELVNKVVPSAVRTIKNQLTNQPCAYTFFLCTETNREQGLFLTLQHTTRFIKCGSRTLCVCSRMFRRKLRTKLKRKSSWSYLKQVFCPAQRSLQLNQKRRRMPYCNRLIWMGTVSQSLQEQM